MKNIRMLLHILRQRPWMMLQLSPDETQDGYNIAAYGAIRDEQDVALMVFATIQKNPEIKRMVMAALLFEDMTDSAISELFKATEK